MVQYNDHFLKTKAEIHVQYKLQYYIMLSDIKRTEKEHKPQLFR